MGRKADSRIEVCGANINQESCPAELIPTLARRLPASFHDVADLAHSTNVGIRDALPSGTAITVSPETIVGLTKKIALLGRRGGRGVPVLSGHAQSETSGNCICSRDCEHVGTRPAIRRWPGYRNPGTAIGTQNRLDVEPARCPRPDRPYGHGLRTRSRQRSRPSLLQRHLAQRSL